MSFVKIAAFVVIEKKDEETVTESIHEVLDGFVARRVAVFDSGLSSTAFQDVENADEIRAEILEPDHGD